MLSNVRNIVIIELIITCIVSIWFWFWAGFTLSSASRSDPGGTQALIIAVASLGMVILLSRKSFKPAAIYVGTALYSLLLIVCEFLIVTAQTERVSEEWQHRGQGVSLQQTLQNDLSAIIGMIVLIATLVFLSMLIASESSSEN